MITNGTFTNSLTTRKVVISTLVVLTVALAFLMLYRFRAALLIIFAGIVLSIAMAPGVNWLHRRNLPRAFGVIVIYFVLFAVLIGFVILIVPQLIEQINMAIPTIASYYQDVRANLLTSPYPLVRELALQLPNTINLLSNNVAPAGEPGALDTMTQTLTMVGSFTNGLFIIATILLIGFYWTLEGELALRSLLIAVPSDKREYARKIIEEINTRVGGYVRGQGILAITVGLATLVVYMLIGLPYALAVALLAGVFELVPVIGPTLAAIPAVLVALVSDPLKVLWVIAISALIQFLENNLLAPRIMHRTVGVNPIVTLLAIVAFGSFLGFAGLLLAIPITALIQVMLERSMLSPEDPMWQPSSGRDRLSKLRLDTQEYLLDLRKLARDNMPHSNGDADTTVQEALETIALDLDNILTQTITHKGSL